MRSTTLNMAFIKSPAWIPYFQEERDKKETLLFFHSIMLSVYQQRTKINHV